MPALLWSKWKIPRAEQSRSPMLGLSQGAQGGCSAGSHKLLLLLLLLLSVFLAGINHNVKNKAQVFRALEKRAGGIQTFWKLWLGNVWCCLPPLSHVPSPLQGPDILFWLRAWKLDSPSKGSKAPHPLRFLNYMAKSGPNKVNLYMMFMEYMNMCTYIKDTTRCTMNDSGLWMCSYLHGYLKCISFLCVGFFPMLFKRFSFI